MHLKDPRGSSALTDVPSEKVWTTQRTRTQFFKDGVLQA